MSGRTKKPRIITLDIQNMTNKHMGPVGITKTALKSLPVTTLEADEIQALARRDVEKLNMLDAAHKMGISKTVFAGIYTSARTKLSSALIHGEAIYIAEQEDESEEDTTTNKPTKTQASKKTPTKKTSSKANTSADTDISQQADQIEDAIVEQELQEEKKSKENNKKTDKKDAKKKKDKKDKKSKKNSKKKDKNDKKSKKKKK